MTSLQALSRVVLIGCGATLILDIWLVVLRRIGVQTLNAAFIGRWVGLFFRGRIAHASIGKAPQIPHETSLGWLTHYAAGIVFAALLVSLAGSGWMTRPSLGPALPTGAGTVAFPLLVMQPAMLGGVSGTFKTFMDATGGLWRAQQLKGRLAAGFTVSSLPAGDKQSTLVSLFIFCMQHGMLWVGNPILPEQQRGVPYDEAANRLGSWSGLMAQAGHASPPDAFAVGDVRTARMFGRYFAETSHRLAPAASPDP